MATGNLLIRQATGLVRSRILEMAARQKENAAEVKGPRKPRKGNLAHNSPRSSFSAQRSKFGRLVAVTRLPVCRTSRNQCPKWPMVKAFTHLKDTCARGRTLSTYVARTGEQGSRIQLRAKPRFFKSAYGQASPVRNTWLISTRHRWTYGLRFFEECLQSCHTQLH